MPMDPGTRIPGRIRHQTHSAAPRTIIKMPRLKGDIPNLRLFVSIKHVAQLLARWRSLPYRNNALRSWVSRVNGNSIRFIKPTGPTIPETFNFASVTSTETFLSTFGSFNSLVALAGLGAPGGPKRRYGWAPRQFRNRGEERRSPLRSEIYFWVQDGWNQPLYLC